MVEFDVTRLAERTGRFVVSVYVLNEFPRLHRQLEKMRPWLEPARADVIVADGGSTDGGTEPAALRALGVTALLTKRSPGKLGTQMEMALGWAMSEGYAGVINMDGNDKDDPDALVRFADALSAGDDHVQGSRFIRGGRSIHCPSERYWGIRLIHAPAISLAAGRRCTDTTNGFRAYSRRLITDPRSGALDPRFRGYERHYHVAVRASRLGFRCREIPVTRRYPASGPPPTKIHGLRAHLGVLSALADACLWGT